MQLEWAEHPKQLVDGVAHLHKSAHLLDVTLSAEGRQLKAHRVILASASTYFRDILTSQEASDDRFPIIFLKDVAFSELQCLVQFIYSGKTDVPGNGLSSFLKLANALGVKGFSDMDKSSSSKKTPTKRKTSELQKDKENATRSPFKKWSASEPVNMPSLLSNEEEACKLKRRKIHSLDDVEDYKITPPAQFKNTSGQTPLSPLVLSPFWSNVSPTLMEKAKPSPLAANVKHSSHLSCPVDTPSPSRVTNTGNFSFDSTFPMLDPNMLAAKGATLLHHLAVWMIEEQRGKDANETTILEQPNDVTEKTDTKEKDASVGKTSDDGGDKSNLEAVASSSKATNPALNLRRGQGGSECDRPDSGFDSKDEDEVNKAQSLNQEHQHQVSETISEEVRTSSGETSPDITVEISRQAPIRQPVFRKRRLNIN